MTQNASHKVTSTSYDRLKSRYVVDVAIDDTQSCVFEHLNRGHISESNYLVLAVSVDQPLQQTFDVYIDNPGQTSRQLSSGQTAQLVVALRPGQAKPGSGTASLRCTLKARPKGGEQIEIPFVIEVRLVTSELGEPDVTMNIRSEIGFGIADEGAQAPGRAVLGRIRPTMPPSLAVYHGPPADFVLEAEAFIIGQDGRPWALPLQLGQCRPGLDAADDVLWSGGTSDGEMMWPNRNPPARQTMPYPFGREPHEFIVGVPVREAIRLVRRISQGHEFSTEIALDVSVHLNGALLDEKSYRIRAQFDLSTALIVSSREFGRTMLVLSSRAPGKVVRAQGAIRRRLNLRGAQQASGIEARFPLEVAVAAEAHESRLSVDFAFEIDGAVTSFATLGTSCEDPVAGSQVSVPLRSIVEQAILKGAAISHVPRRGDLLASFRFIEAREGAEPAFVVLSIPIEIEMIPPGLICCIDLGTSATSVWFGTHEPPNIEAVLPLGELVHALTGDVHEEFDTGRGARNVLLPSLIGVGSDHNLRARYDPLSLGDLALTAGGMEGAERRLSALERTYDISVPFVARQDIPRHHASIVFDPKRSMIAPEASAPEIHAFERVNRQVSSATRVDIPKLLIDVFDELGAYLVPRALDLLDERNRSWTRAKGGSLTELWLRAESPVGVIVTHPSGIGARSRQTYVEAGQRFLARFAGMPIGASASQLWVKLVPEAIAAMNYGIGFLRERGQLPEGRHVLSAVDIGAGTYDATLVEADIGPNGLRDWTILSHFGATVGGIDLDRAITEKVESLLIGAFDHERVSAAFSLDRMPAGTSATQTQRFARDIAFKDEVQRAKKQLTARLHEARDGGDYVWSKGSGVFLEVVVGREPDRESLPVRRRQATRVIAEQRIVINETGPLALAVRPASGGEGGVEIILQIGPHYFTPDGSEAFDALNPAVVARFLGTVLPRMIMREVERLGTRPPIWIVTGRTALWPPLYAAITAVADAVPGSRMATRRPFDPSEMKEAVIRGALALASSPHLPLGNDVLNPLAVLSIAAEPQAVEASDGSSLRRRRITRIGAIHYLKGSDKVAGSDNVSCSGRCELVRAVPGLSDPRQGDRPDEEAFQMFDAFKISPYEVLFQDIAPARPTEAHRPLEISWNAGDRFTTLTIDAGDGRGPQSFEFLNRESRVYHD